MRTVLLALFALALLGGPSAAKKKRPKPPHPPAAEPAPEAAPPSPAEPAEAPPAAEPAPEAAPTPPPPPSPPPPQPVQVDRARVDLEGLNEEYNQLRDELFRSRAKVAMLGSALFKTRMVVTFQYKAQRAWPLGKVSLLIDDQPAYSVDAPSAEEPIKLYEGFTVPGRHSVELRVECGAVGTNRLGYTAAGRFTFDIDDGRQARVEVVADEVGDGPQALDKKKQGTFDVRLRAKVKNLPGEAKK